MSIKLYIILFAFCWNFSAWALTSDSSPTTKWPYLFEEFQEGVVHFTSGEKTKTMELNIHLEHCALHFLEGDRIRQYVPRDVQDIQIGNNTYLYTEIGLVRLVKKGNGVSLVESVKADLTALSRGETGAYGMDTNSSSVQGLSTFSLNGISNLSHTQMKVEREEGRELPLEKAFYFVTTDKLVKATRKDIEKSLDEAGKAKFKAFLKQNKIKWKSEASLSVLLEFFHQ